MESEVGVESPLLSVAEAAAYLGMSKDWVYERLKTFIPHVKIGGALKFRREDLDRYIAAQTVFPMNIRDVKTKVAFRELMRGSHPPMRRKERANPHAPAAGELP
jgi:excisionase family DNA binding protein